MAELSKEQPILNQMIEDFLARGETEGDHAMMLAAWLTLGAEYMARLAGRKYALHSIDNLRAFITEADPVKPWKP
jgi:hypothetical protein